MTNYLDLIIVFVLGLVSGSISTYLGHLFSVRRSKMERFLPYLQRLHGIVARIMERSEARELSDRYRTLINVRVEQKIREDAYKEIMKEEKTRFPHLSPVDVAYTFFVLSYSKLVELIGECRNYESVYTEMEKKGLLKALKVRNKRLYGELSWFHNSTNYIAEETRDIIEELEAKTKVRDPKKPESIFQSDIIDRMLTLSTHNLFHFGLELEKRLRKYV